MTGLTASRPAPPRSPAIACCPPPSAAAAAWWRWCWAAKGSGATVESFSETAKLYNWAYNNFSMRQVAATDELYRQPVALSKQTDTVMLYPAQSAEAFLPKDAKDEDIRKTVDLKEDVVNAPITAGQELGTLTITYNDQVCAQVPLLAQADVSASRFLVAKAPWRHFLPRRG